MIAYNAAEHKSTGCTSYELVFGQKAQFLSSFKQIKQNQSYTELLESMTKILSEMRTMAAMT